MIQSLQKSRGLKSFCYLMSLILFFQVGFPISSSALTSGAVQPEFSSFEPVVTTDLVNEFTGDFTYNLPVLSIPGPDGGGYALSLSYHSGVSAEDEASWCGTGFNINPGTIGRQLRGHPDDFKNIPIIKYNKVKPNWTQSSTTSFNVEINSKDKDKKSKGEGAGKSKSMFNLKFDLKEPPTPPEGSGGVDDAQYENLFSFSLKKIAARNNYSGFSITNSFGANYKGMASLNMTRSGGENVYGFSVNPMGLLNSIKLKEKTRNKINEKFRTSKISKAKASVIKKINSNLISKTVFGIAKRHMPSSYAAKSYNVPALPYSINYNTGRSFNFSGSVQLNPYGPVGFQVGIAGNLNSQINIPEVSFNTFGYMYQPNFSYFENMVGKDYYKLKEEGIPIVEGDFQIERPTTFNKHDRYLGIPYNNADLYTATGNDILGAFQFYPKKIGTSYPSMVTNKQQVRQVGAEFAIGGTISIGVDIGLGFQKTVTDKWNLRNVDTLEFDNSKMPFPHFSNDMGGMLRYSNHDTLQYATINKTHKLLVDNFDQQVTVKDDVIGQSSTIQYSIFGNDRNLANVLDKGHKELKGVPSQVGQIAVTNKDGSKSFYGLPVYSKEETSLSVELGENNFDDGEYIAYHNLEYDEPLKNKTALGQRVDTPYVTTYLLTQNTTFDYVDVNNNGADEADFGGWTKFNYRKVWGNTANDWYRFRAPYTGLFYDKGRLFDLKDQTGSMSSGYKEVYYLDNIETKSHVAFFITNKTDGTVVEDSIETRFNVNIPDGALDQYLHGSQLNRLDGYDAGGITSGGQDDAANNSSARGNHQLEKLEKIVLFSKSDFSTPITTTYFEYDYSLCQEIPNSTGGSYGEQGKLTLKKVWTESGGTIKSRISPYRFKYEYNTTYPSRLINGKYSDILSLNNGDNYYANLSSSDQNPDYDPMLLDMWGNYRLDGKERFEKMQPWVDQKPAPSNYDPAAWQLKQIILPSGGSIDIQYEAKDYRFVQNKNPMAMVALKDHVNEINGYKSGNDNKYFIDLASIGLTSSDATAYASFLRTFFEKEKLYYKALYAYEGSPAADLKNNPQALKKMDYITGYSIVDSVGVDGNNIYFQLGERKKNGNGKNDKTLPRWLCFIKYLTASGNNLHAAPYEWENSDDEISTLAYEDFNNDGEIDILTKSGKNKVLREIGKTQAVSGTFRLFNDWSDSDFGPLLRNKLKKNVCKELNHSLSYFKLPLHRPKKGGGIRVKRLISYDPGLESGDAMIYGTEYIYKSEDGKSSGIATNEPPQGREENPLIGIIERNPQKKLNKLLNGRLPSNLEGKIGISLYPGASVVHERVIIKNIHAGETATGFRVNEFYTVKDYPTLKEGKNERQYSNISKDNKTFRKLNLSLPLGLLNFNKQTAKATQGYLFKMNDMHGKPKRQSSYPGDYSLNQFNSNTFSSRTDYQYSEPGDSINTLVYDPATQIFKTETLSPGTVEDLTMYESNVKDKTWDFNVELDLNITLPYAISLGLSPTIAFEDKNFSQHVTTKVLSQKSYLLSTTSTTDGIAQTTENIAFDKYTGDPVLTMTYDGYERRNKEIYTRKSGSDNHKGNYYQLNIPASWVYEDMSPNSSYAPNDNSNQLSASTGSITTYGVNPVASFMSNNSGKFKDVIGAASTIYTSNWFDGNGSHSLSELDFNFLGYESNLNKNYYPYRTYVYRGEVGSANTEGYQIYDGGLIEEVSGFNWLGNTFEDSVVYNNWFSSSKILAYSPHGYPIAEQDVLGIRSIAKFGYEKQLPVLVAQNADYETSHFIDFEYSLPSIDGNSIIDNKAHSGEYAYNLSMNPTETFIENFSLTKQLVENGASLKFWLHSSLTNNPSDPNYGLQNDAPSLKAIINYQFYECKKIAQTGEWSLYEAKINNWYGAPQNTLMNVSLDYSFQPNEMVLIDDLKFQPSDAVMNCTVYHKDFKVAAQFDDQHFGVFYNYDLQGNLVSKSIETERGRKTLQEQHNNSKTINRNAYD